MTLNSAEEHEHAVILLYHSGHLIAVIPQTFVYGIYAILVPVSSYVMLHRGLVTRARKVLFATTIFMFLLSTVYWIVSIITLIQLIQSWLLSPDPDASTPTTTQLPLFNALILVNFILTDGVVVWRAWLLCGNDGKKALLLCLLILSLSTVSAIATIAIRITLTIIDTDTVELFNKLHHGIDITQVATLVLSFLTNSLTTALISFKAWRSRLEIQDDINVGIDIRSKARKIFVLLIETGVLYSFSCLIHLVSAFIPLREGTMGDLYTPVATQLAGIYPVVVLLLVTHNHTLDQTVRAFSFGIEQSTGEQHPHSNTMLETMHIQQRSAVTMSGSSDSWRTSGRYGAELDDVEHNRQSDQSWHVSGHDLNLPPIPSGKITWGSEEGRK